MRASSLLPAVICALLPAAPAQAADAAPGTRPKIIVVVDHADDSMPARLASDPLMSGFDVAVVQKLWQTEERHLLEAAARKAEAVAAVRVVPAESAAVDVWIADRVTGKTLQRRIESGLPNTAPDETTVTAHVIELLRGSFLEIEMSHPSRGEVSPPPAVRQLVPPISLGSRASLRLKLGAAALWSPGGLSPSMQALVSLSWVPWQRLGVEAFAMLPVISSDVSRGQDSASIDARGAGLGVVFQPQSVGRRFRPTLGAGAMVLWLQATGRAQDPFTGTTDSVVTAAPYVRASAGLPLTPWLRIGVDIIAGVSVPRVGVQFAENDIAHWGMPFAIGAITAELSAY